MLCFMCTRTKMMMCQFCFVVIWSCLEESITENANREYYRNEGGIPPSDQRPEPYVIVTYKGIYESRLSTHKPISLSPFRINLRRTPLINLTDCSPTEAVKIHFYFNNYHQHHYFCTIILEAITLLLSFPSSPSKNTYFKFSIIFNLAITNHKIVTIP